MKIKRDRLDILFSKLVRERAGWVCERCGRYFPEDKRGGLHCSHFYSRRHVGTRWLPDNAAAHCFACHQRLGENPLEFTEWVERHLGKGRAEQLQQRVNTICKLTRAQKGQLYEVLKAEYDKMLAERNKGVKGRIEFANPYEVI